MAVSKIDMQGKDNASQAFASVTAKITDLRAQIAAIKGNGDIPINLKDFGNISRLDREANSLERRLARVTGEANTTAPAIANVGTSAGGAASKLGMLTKGLGAIGLAVSAGALVKGALDIAQLGESAARSEIYFKAFSGSASDAAKNLAAMQKATDGALTSQQAMQAASKLMSMGLANNAGELEKVAHMAVMLGGDTRTASEAVNEFSLLLANASVQRLDTFGLNTDRVRARIEELQAATKGLSRESAFMTAVMEQGSAKVKLLEEAGLQAASSTDILKASVGNLKIELGKLVEQPYTVTINVATKAVQAATFALSDEGAAQRAYANAFQDYAAAARSVQDAQADLASGYAKLNPLARANYEIKLDEAQAALDVAEANYRVAQAAFASAGASTDQAEGLDDVADSASTAARHMDDFADATARAWAMTSQLQVGIGGAALRQFAAGTDQQYDPVPAQEAAIKARQALERELGKANTTTANDYQTKMQSAIDKLASSVKSKLSAAQTASIGLNDMRTGGTGKPGENGPAENIFRLQAWINDGSWQETADALGIKSKEAAAQIVQDFQNGLMTPDVENALDIGMLIENIKIEQAAEASQKAFGEKIAAAAGLTNVGTVLASDALSSLGAGFTADEKGAGAAADKMLSAFAGGAEVVVKADSLKARLSEVGKTAWSWTEGGFVAAAGASSALISAIDGMVATSLARRGVGAAMSSAGG